MIVILHSIFVRFNKNFLKLQKEYSDCNFEFVNRTINIFGMLTSELACLEQIW